MRRTEVLQSIRQMKFEDHGYTLSYNFVRLALQSHGRTRKAARRGVHRRKRAQGIAG